MHSATANDYMPNGPLLLARTHLLLHGPLCGSVPRNSLASEEMFWYRAVGMCPGCQALPQGRRAWAKGWQLQEGTSLWSLLGGCCTAHPEAEQFKLWRLAAKQETRESVDMLHPSLSHLPVQYTYGPDELCCPKKISGSF